MTPDQRSREERETAVNYVARYGFYRVINAGMTPREAVEEQADSYPWDLTVGEIEDAITHVETATVEVLQEIAERIDEGGSA